MTVVGEQARCALCYLLRDYAKVGCDRYDRFVSSGLMKRGDRCVVHDIVDDDLEKLALCYDGLEMEWVSRRVWVCCAKEK